MNRAEKRRKEAAARREGVDPHAAQMQMAGAQYNAGRFREAAALCDAILTKSGIHGHALFLGGLCRLRMGDADSAARMLRRAAQLMPDNAQVHAQFASAQIALRDVEGAAKSFTSAIAAKPDFAEAHAHLGMLESWRGDHAAAAARFEEALRLEPSNPGVLLNAANGRLRGGDPHGAAELYQRILAIRADITEAHFGLGQALREIGDIEGAIDN
nr:tetratricopeptide repeat protein [Rhizobiaceae bacterium]